MKPSPRSTPEPAGRERAVEVRVHRAISEIPREKWDALDGAARAPFLSWTWLDALERTGCVGEGTGWAPHHLSFWADSGAKGPVLLGAAPAYLKGNSEGEFVFDHGWAGAARRFGVRYYPKLIVAIPFTPATETRLLVADPALRPVLVPVLAEALRKLVAAHEISGAHVLFPRAEEAAALVTAGLAERHGVQFQWSNPGYTSFEDFLKSLPSKRRTQIRRERREVREASIRVETLRGSDLTPEIVDHAVAFYLSTVDKFVWGRRYLKRAFFEEVCSKLPGVEIVIARDAGNRPIGGAFNLAGDRVLYGRYWGASKDVPFLHFEVCYYHSVEDCIARKLVRFEPGAGGSHKRSRGFDPTRTYSAHHVADARFDAAIRAFLAEEREAIARMIDAGEEPGW